MGVEAVKGCRIWTFGRCLLLQWFAMAGGYLYPREVHGLFLTGLRAAPPLVPRPSVSHLK